MITLGFISLAALSEGRTAAARTASTTSAFGKEMFPKITEDSHACTDSVPNLDPTPPQVMKLDANTTPAAIQSEIGQGVPCGFRAAGDLGFSWTIRVRSRAVY